MDPGQTCDYGLPETLFYFDDFSDFCEEFTYLGCGGNGNSFPNMTACESFCLIQGAARPFPPWEK